MGSWFIEESLREEVSKARAQQPAELPAWPTLSTW